ncbi:hypothetical protein ACJJI3_04955 [Microbulbifer sp. ZKSA004]|uniref:hypothetical protein n=1 Tax=Microbulbifer sp. ZKSA004 TaxID=3243389 RepID=UPI00403A5EBF
MVSSFRKDELSRGLCNLLTEAYLKVKDLGYDEIVTEFDKVERTHAPHIQEYPDLILETKRRVAEMKFLLLSSDKGLPFEVIQGLHKDVRDLGYLNIDSEDTLETIFCRHCLNHQKYALAIEVATALKKSVLSELDSSRDSKEAYAYKAIARCDRLISLAKEHL